MKYLECGAKQREGAKFWKSCGNKTDLACPQSGNARFSDSVFCDGCGYDLRKLEPAKLLDLHPPRSYTPGHLAARMETNAEPGVILVSKKLNNAWFQVRYDNGARNFRVKMSITALSTEA